MCEVNNGYAAIVAYSQNTCTSGGLKGIIEEIKEIVEDNGEKIFENGEKIEEVETEVGDNGAKLDLNAENIEDVKTEVQEVKEIVEDILEIARVEGKNGIIERNHQLATIDEWGPFFKITFDLIIYSNIDSNIDGWSSVLAFRGNGAVDDASNYGDRVPAIFYNNIEGYLLFANSVNGDPNFNIIHYIELNRLYNIKITQKEKDGQVSEPEI